MKSVRRSGQGMTEYIIIVALVAIASIAVVTIFGDQIRELFSASSQNLAGNAVEPTQQGNSQGEVNKKINDY
jgi:Flp pilus assembly pilin Flp